ncbi:MAG: hypothetical protein ACJA0Z_002192 [Halioglobus sp.]|jgi:hypothetical protein
MKFISLRIGFYDYPLIYDRLAVSVSGLPAQLPKMSESRTSPVRRKKLKLKSKVVRLNADNKP